jgi:lysophospholipase L1-like esterase
VKRRNTVAANILTGRSIGVDDLGDLSIHNAGHYAADGVHFNADGIKAQARKVAESVSALLDELP